MTFKALTNCLACGSDELEQYLNLGYQIPANALRNSRESVDSQTAYPLKANYCHNCGHSQLSGIVDPKIIYKDYTYVSGTTKTLRDHFKELVKYVHKFIPEHSKILDIGSNDGTLLREFKNCGDTVQGVDPAELPARLAEKQGIPTFVQFWSSQTNLNSSFDAITACNVFAHNPNPMEFLDTCRKHLSKEGILAIEFPWTFNIINGSQPDQIYHEHINYFTSNSMRVLAERIGFEIINYKYFPGIHGGSICYILALQKSKENVIDSLIEREKELYNINTYKKFSKKFTLNMEELLRVVQREDRKIILYGAAAKGAVVLNFIQNNFNINLSNYIHSCIDDNSLKWGKCIPGTMIEVVSPSDVYSLDENKLFIVSAWNFIEEIKHNISLRDRGQPSILTYVPFIKINPLVLD